MVIENGGKNRGSDLEKFEQTMIAFSLPSIQFPIKIVI